MQAFVHIGVATSVIPITGQPLPFISKGGSSILFTGIAFGIILSVSKELEKNKERKNELEQNQDNN
jgi:cell division protein FtsW